MKKKFIKLSQAQQSAMECRDWSEEPAVDWYWVRPDKIYLPYSDDILDQLISELIEASNAEDAHADPRINNDSESRKYAGRASRALSKVTDRLITAYRAN